MDIFDWIEIIAYVVILLFIFIGTLLDERTNLRRYKISKDLEGFMKRNEPNFHLVNKNFQCIFIQNDNSLFRIYIKERTNGYRAGACFDSIIFEKQNALSIWAYIQKNYKKFYDANRLIVDIKKNLDIDFSPIDTIDFSDNWICQNEYLQAKLNTKAKDLFFQEIYPQGTMEPRFFTVHSEDLSILTRIHYRMLTEFKLFNYEKLIDALKQEKNLVLDIPNEIKQVDINNAGLEELKNLPIVNVVTAKKLIKKREEIGGFKSVQDVCIFLRLTFSQEERFKNLICINPMKISPASVKHDERNVDL